MLANVAVKVVCSERKETLFYLYPLVAVAAREVHSHISVVVIQIRSCKSIVVARSVKGMVSIIHTSSIQMSTPLKAYLT